MNGAESLIQTLAGGGIEVCLANPGTSEMHIVAALDQNPAVRPVLGLFEGVITGAADGYARMADKPAMTLLHLGPGLANGLANLHNARRARSPVLNIVGDHATYHRRYDTPLTSDIASMAGPVSGWVKEATDADTLPALGLEALEATRHSGGQVATLIVPADTAWSEAEPPLERAPQKAAKKVEAETIADIAGLLHDSGQSTVIVMNGPVLRERGLVAAGAIARATGAGLYTDTFTPRVQRGAGRVAVDRLPYMGKALVGALAGFDHLVIVGTRPPASFFAYPGRPSLVLPEGCQVHRLAGPEEDGTAALEDLAAELAGNVTPELRTLSLPDLPAGKLDADKAGAVIAHFLPEGAVVSDESTTSGVGAWLYTKSARPHDWLSLTGGSIGQGIPLGTGAAIARPQSKVICLQGDGGAMYTISALWTQAREGLDVVNVIFANRKYAILQIELFRMGFKGPGPASTDLFDLSRPDIDFVKLAESMGVQATKAETAEQFAGQFAAAVSRPGPHLIEAVLA